MQVKRENVLMKFEDEGERADCATRLLLERRQWRAEALSQGVEGKARDETEMTV